MTNPIERAQAKALSQELKGDNDTAASASRYLEITNQISKLEAEKKALQSALKLVAAKGDVNEKGAYVIEVDGYKLMLSPAERENFDLNRARAVLDADLLSPFVKRSQYEVLRVKATK